VNNGIVPYKACFEPFVFAKPLAKLEALRTNVIGVLMDYLLQPLGAGVADISEDL